MELGRTARLRDEPEIFRDELQSAREHGSIYEGSFTWSPSMRSFALIALAALACSAQAQTTEPEQAAAEPSAATTSTGTPATPVPAATPATVAAPATEAAPETPANPQTGAPPAAGQRVEEAEAAKKYQPPPGYRPEIRVSDGAKVYCRVEDVIGTRFTKKVCYSELELEAVRARNESEANDVTRRSRVCSSAAVCSSN